VTDSPGGHAKLPPDWLARRLGADPARIVLHLTCKDRNRNALEAAAWKYASEGFNNIVAMTGDYPRSGYGGTASPVFDLDSVGLISLLDAMNHGLPVPGRKGQTAFLPKTNLFIGCVVSPFKRRENELMPQYFKLLHKIAGGARYIYTQVGYDMRKFYEVKLLLAAHGLDVPVIGTVYLLNRTVAEVFHRGEIPGCVVSDALLAQVNKYAAGPDKGRAFFLDLAAKQLAVFRGLGFAAGYLCGMTKAETCFDIIERAERFGPNDWREFAKEIQFGRAGEFYLYEPDPATGLGDPNRLNREYLRSLAQPEKTRNVTLGYRFSRFMHDHLFTPGTVGWKLMKRLYSRWDKQPGPVAHAAHNLERMSKLVFYGCRDCGDCSLPDIGNLCPLASCAKDMRNGPCGGTDDGQCEVRELGLECIWARAYDRLKFYKESADMLQGPVVMYNPELKNTSAWANAVLGRDHHHYDTEPKKPDGPAASDKKQN
jgi:methylenetetrahydrofolate reductase (NADPH)